MCGIIGYTGKKPAQDILLDGLARLEYRGYDSAGIAYFRDASHISVRKTAGKVADLRAICDENDTTAGIGHTRWATHGGVTNANAHPHKQGRVALIHNGIIENYHDEQARVLLVSPIRLGQGVGEPGFDPEFDEESVEKSKRLKEVYRQAAAEYGCEFLGASDYAGPSKTDREHLDPEGHAALAEAFYEKIQEMS